jgi:6-phosphofructo-2-kinase / fructose-2,6-biphosphatase 4
VNPTSQNRRYWKEILEQHGIQTIFIESSCDNREIIEQNVRSVKISSPDVIPYQKLAYDSTSDGILMMP